MNKIYILRTDILYSVFTKTHKRFRVTDVIRKDTCPKLLLCPLQYLLFLVLCSRLSLLSISFSRMDSHLTVLPIVPPCHICMNRPSSRDCMTLWEVFSPHWYLLPIMVTHGYFPLNTDRRRRSLCQLIVREGLLNSSYHRLLSFIVLLTAVWCLGSDVRVCCLPVTVVCTTSFRM